MEPSPVYVAMSLLVLVVSAGLALAIRRKMGVRTLTPLAGLAFAFIVAGMFFGENRWLGYGLLGIGIALAIGDMVMRLRARP